MRTFSTSDDTKYIVQQFDGSEWNSHLSGKTDYTLLKYASLKAAKLAKASDRDYRIVDPNGRVVWQAPKQLRLIE